MLDLLLIEPPLFRLDARPFYGKPVTIMPERYGDIEIPFETMIVVYRFPDDGNPAFPACLRPVHVLYPSFDLER